MTSTPETPALLDTLRLARRLVQGVIDEAVSDAADWYDLVDQLDAALAPDRARILSDMAADDAGEIMGTAYVTPSDACPHVLPDAGPVICSTSAGGGDGVERPGNSPEAGWLMLVERAFKAGLAYAGICEIADPDEAWRTSNIRLAALRAQSAPVGDKPVTVGVDLASGPDQTAVTLINPTQAALDVLAERQRQISAEGWTPEHDDKYRDAHGDLPRAAACYALSAAGYRGDDVAMLRFWPWVDEWWRPTTPRRDLVKAGALILAEIERLDRAAPVVGEGGSAKWGPQFPPSSCNAWEDCVHDGVCHDPRGCGAPSQHSTEDGE